jgi:hypothetical protein
MVKGVRLEIVLFGVNRRPMGPTCRNRLDVPRITQNLQVPVPAVAMV